jgi:hypothetical protein
VDGTAEDEAEQLPLAPSAIKAVDELGQVERKMLAAHSVEGAAKPGLEVSEDPVDPRQDLRRSGGVGPLDASVVPYTDGGETPVALESIRSDRGSRGVHDAPNEGAEVVVEGQALDHSEPGTARVVRALLHGSSDEGLVSQLTTATQTASSSPDVGLVDLDETRDPISRAGTQGGAQFVEHRQAVS